MAKYVSVLVLLLGVGVNIILLSNIYIFEWQMLFGLFLGGFGAIASIININNCSSSLFRIISIIAAIINIFPVIYFIILIFSIG